MMELDLFSNDTWAETELGTKWGDEWEEKFFAGTGATSRGDLACISEWQI